MVKSAFAIPVGEVHFEINLRTLAQGMWVYIYWKTNKMAVGKRDLSSQHTAKLANLDMGHPPEIFSEGILLESQIFGTSQYANSGQKTALRFRSSQYKQLINMHEICPIMSNLTPVSGCFYHVH